MPYETRTRDVEKTQILGYDSIPLHRPKFIYFEFTGLRPSFPHWIYFGGIEVTKFVNTSYTKANYEAAGRDSVLKEPGEKFINASQFPTDSGLTYGGATAQGGTTDPLYTTANGILKGVFYLQSNNTYNWSINADGTELLAIDQYNIDKNNTYSYGSALFRGFGQYENYWSWFETENYQVWVDPPTSHDDGGDDSLVVTHDYNENTGELEGFTFTQNSGGHEIKTVHEYEDGKMTGGTVTSGNYEAVLVFVDPDGDGEGYWTTKQVKK